MTIEELKAANQVLENVKSDIATLIEEHEYIRPSLSNANLTEHQKLWLTIRSQLQEQFNQVNGQKMDLVETFKQEILARSLMVDDN